MAIKKSIASCAAWFAVIGLYALVFGGLIMFLKYVCAALLQDFSQDFSSSIFVEIQ